MATKKFIELQDMADADLVNEFKETKVQLNKLKLDHAVRGIENPLVIREVRRDVARLKTEVRRREIAAMDESALAGRANIRRRRRIK
jgi:large subunit ribosomal protein L29